MASDAELLYAWRAGSADAGDQLCARCYEPVARFFANKVTEDLGDLVQDCFKACVERRDRIVGEFRSYLLGVAYNVFKRYLRTKYRTPEEALSSRSVQDIAPGPSTMVRDAEEKRLLLMALRELPVDMQVALELKYWEGMKSADIAAVLGVEASTVRSYLRRGRIQLEKKLAALGSLAEDSEA